MKKILSLQFVVIIILGLLSLNSCKQGLRCDAEDNEKLGEIAYDDILHYNIESDELQLNFEGINKSISLPLINVSDRSPHWWIDHEICESLDVKPYRAYAYYEYDNLNQVFGNDSTLISIEPQIINDAGNELEALYINIAHENQALKGIIMVDQSDSYQPELDIFEFEDYLQINGIVLTDVWRLQKEGLGVYYNKNNGVEAIQIDNVYFFKQ